jgi:hypothetical protein
MEYYLTIKRNKVLAFATTWIHLENIIPGKMPDTKNKYYMIPFIGNVQNGKIHRHRK